MSAKAITSTKYIVLSESNTEKRPGESWREILIRWLVRCPQCQAQWLVVGARENDLYVCKDCGHGFAIKLSVTSNSASDDVNSDAA
jgi:transposase-like protein